MLRNLIKSTMLLLFITKFIMSVESATRLESAHGAFASDVYEIKIHDKFYIKKTFKDQSDFTNELEKVLALQEPLKKYMAGKNLDMPNFALYHSHDSHSIIYEKSTGEALWDFFIRAATTEIDLSTAKGDFVNDHTKSVMEMLRKAGRSIAKFHLRFKKAGNGNSFLTCVHGDMSPSNVFFNLYDGSITFIDYSTFSCPEKKDVAIDIDRLLNPYEAIGSDLKYGIMGVLHNKRLYGQAFEREYQNNLQRLQALKIVIAKGYNDALAEESTDFRLFWYKQGKDTIFELKRMAQGR